MQTILIIDDDTAIGNLEQEILEREGYGVPSLGLRKCVRKYSVSSA